MSEITKADVVNVRFRALCKPEPGVLSEELPGYSLNDVPGLGVCRSVLSVENGMLQAKKSWSVFHIGSGRKIGEFYPTAMQALIVCRALRGLVDWTQSAEQIKTIPGVGTAVKSILDAFLHATKGAKKP